MKFGLLVGLVACMFSSVAQASAPLEGHSTSECSMSVESARTFNSSLATAASAAHKEVGELFCKVMASVNGGVLTVKGCINGADNMQYVAAAAKEASGGHSDCVRNEVKVEPNCSCSAK